MAIENFPDLMLANVKVSSEFFNWKHTSQNKSTLMRSRDLQQFKVEFSIVCKNAMDAQQLRGFIASIEGDGLPFYMKLKKDTVSLGGLYGSPVVTTAEGAGVSNINVSGFSGSFLSGQLIQFLNDPKVYTLTANTKNNGVLKVKPSLRKPVDLHTPVVFGDEVKFKLRLEKGQYDFNYKNGEVLIVKFTALEDLGG
ncbi:hypothetical protein C942_00506 [Photobacterium marinum]|uniref:Uncharacterized protein n=1 Tax=Photobacterium marinum TaxID=1056511 RepID=L8JEV6_9GAMM|nr:hypothetical protein [Photobacterium marinum]ELR66064.1 hypothetical protein C942_00506 [Photobacterium marinum]